MKNKRDDRTQKLAMIENSLREMQESGRDGKRFLSSGNTIEGVNASKDSKNKKQLLNNPDE